MVTSFSLRSSLCLVYTSEYAIVRVQEAWMVAEAHRESRGPGEQCWNTVAVSVGLSGTGGLVEDSVPNPRFGGGTRYEW
jgi:hypothetical protein